MEGWPFSAAALLLDTPRVTLRQRLRWLPRALRLLAVVLIGLATTGPTVARARVVPSKVGLDILFLIDASRSMLAQDVEPNRFGAAVRFAQDLAASRARDRLGVMTFAAGSTLQCPLTTDRAAVTRLLRHLSPRDRDEGTALGTALAEAVRLLASTMRGRGVILLLTDGGDNSGRITPAEAARVSAALGVRVDVVAFGRSGPVRFPSEFGFIEVPLEPNTALLEDVAHATAGRYLSAVAGAPLAESSSALDGLVESSATQPVGILSTNLVTGCLTAALGCLGLELALRAGYLRVFP